VKFLVDGKLLFKQALTVALLLMPLAVVTTFFVVVKDRIQNSVKKVEDGPVLVAHSGQTLEQIVSSVKTVSNIVAETAAASREQSSGIEQVNRAAMQMAEMTQQNAALLEEATASSRGMADQARALMQAA
jgi:methyl-accepting chemotaxis protein